MQPTTIPSDIVSPALIVALGFAFALLTLVTLAVQVLIHCKIFAKAGFSWALGLLMLVPIVNMILPFYLAFADWPVQKELRELRQRLGLSARQTRL